MGMIYRPKYKRPDGTVATSQVWWIKFYVDGVPNRESTKTTKERVARQRLRLREGAAARGEPVFPKLNRMRLGDLLDGVVQDYKANGRRSVGHVERRIKLHLVPFFKTGTLAAAITDAEVRRYVTARQAAKASNASINRELAILRRGYRLARRTVTMRPDITMLKEAAPRAGFFEKDQLDAVLAHLPAELRAVFRFMYVTGWRDHSEVLALQWRRHVDFAAQRVSLDAGETKNDDARVFPFTHELEAILREQSGYTRAVERERGMIIPWVFHRRGKRIKDFYGAWRTACTKAGCPGRVPHDFRRTAVRNLVRAGTPERVAMKLTGHKTRAVFDRYHIVTEADLRDAAERLNSLETRRHGPRMKKGH